MNALYYNVRFSIRFRIDRDISFCCCFCVKSLRKQAQLYLHIDAKVAWMAMTQITISQPCLWLLGALFSLLYIVIYSRNIYATIDISEFVYSSMYIFHFKNLLMRRKKRNWWIIQCVYCGFCPLYTCWYHWIYYWMRRAQRPQSFWSRSPNAREDDDERVLRPNPNRQRFLSSLLFKLTRLWENGGHNNKWKERKKNSSLITTI